MAAKRIHNFRNLSIWKNAMTIVEMAYKISSQCPSEEHFSFVNQSVVSIPLNIAEDSGRSTNKDFLNFLNITLSSSFELETQLI